MADVGAESASAAEYCLWFSCLQNVMGEIRARNLHCRILNIESSVVQEDPKQIVRGWEGIWGSITTTCLYFHCYPLGKNGQGDILAQDK